MKDYGISLRRIQKWDIVADTNPSKLECVFDLSKEQLDRLQLAIDSGELRGVTIERV